MRSAPPAWVASARKAALSSDEPASVRSVDWKARQRPSKLGDGVAGLSELPDGVSDGDADGDADEVEEGDPGDAVELEEPVEPEAPGEPSVEPDGLPSALPLSPGVTEPAAPRGASAVASLARSDAWPGRAGSPGRSGRPGRPVVLDRKSVV